MPIPGGWELILILVVLVLLFGAKKLPDMARSIGQSARVFKGEMKGLKDDGAKDDDTKDAADSTATPPADPPAVTPPAQLPPVAATPPAEPVRTESEPSRAAGQRNGSTGQ